MPIDRKHLGVTSDPRMIDVEVGQLRFFAKAIGETNPIYSDEAAARAAGYRAIPAPPTFLFSLHLGAPAHRGDMFDPVHGLGVDMRHLLHGEQHFTCHRCIYAGDRISLTTTTSNIYEKNGGALEFFVQETRAVNVDGELCGEMRSVMILRHE
jgi:acyl dehydratase